MKIVRNPKNKQFFFYGLFVGLVLLIFSLSKMQHRLLQGINTSLAVIMQDA